MILGKRLSFSFLIFCLCSASLLAQKSPASENDLKKQAEKLFQNQKYEDATPMYSQLLSLYPREAIYNYRYGVCLLMSGKDKTGAATYLEAAAKAKETDPDVFFYLGRSYMFMDHYNEAISSFNHFKTLASTAKQSKLQPDDFIHNCEFANELRKDRKNVVVLNKTIVNRTTFFSAYDFTNSAGKLLTTPDRFLTSIDKEKMANPVMFLTKDGETIYYASYGKKGEHGKDIYRIIKLPNGTWSTAMNLGSSINTDENEDFPYLDKDGRTLYFCSKGHNSIGGYDVFKSQYDFNTGKWSDPVNVGIPINTVDDDIFYMPSTKGETAIYSTAIDCESAKIELRNIKLGDVVSNVAVISGSYISKDQVTRRDARITVVRTKDNGVVTSVKTDRTGEYELVLPAGDEYMLVVEGGGYLPHAENFSIPVGSEVTAMQQKVVMNRKGDIEEMAMTNYFTPSISNPSIASSDKPTQVSSNEFDLKDTGTTKMQAMTFDGRTLFVAPPSEKNIKESLSTSAENKDDSSVALNSDVQLHQQSSQQTASGNREQKTEKSSVAEKKGSKPVVSVKTTNTEIVKMAFDDAQSVREEASGIREEAKWRKEEAKSLDSLSVVQARQSKEYLEVGDKEKSEQVANESQVNAQRADQRNKEVQSLDADARQKDMEAEISMREATEMMKQYKVDTNTLAYRKIKNPVDENTDVKENKPENKSDEISNDEVSSSSGNSIIADTVPNSNENEVATIGIHTDRASKLNDEAETFSLKSLEMSQRAENTSDKKAKDNYELKSKEFKKQSDVKKTEAAKETMLAKKTETQPAAVATNNNQASKTGNVESNKPDTNTKLDENLAEKNKVADAAVTMNSKPKESSDKEDNVDNDQKNITPSNTLKENKQTGNESTTGNMTEKNNEVAVAKNPTKNSGENDSQKNKAGEKVNESPVSISQPEIKEKEATEKPKSKTDSGEIKSENESQPKPTEQIKIDPLAATHFNNYQLILGESKKIEQQSSEVQARLITVKAPKDRDSLTIKANQLSQQSVRQWQAAQRELSLAKEIEPAIEEKMEGKSAVAGEQFTKETIKQNLASNEDKNENSNDATINKKAESSSERKIKKTKQETGIETSELKSQTSNLAPETTPEILDTTKPEYPKYVVVQKEILQKQTETVNTFVEGMQLNKKALEIKDREMKLRDQAQLTPDKKEKAMLVDKADSLAMEGDIITKRSKEKLAVAQAHTREVKTLTTQSDKLKEGLIIKQPSETKFETTALAENKTSENEKLEIERKKSATGNSNQKAEDKKTVKANADETKSSQEVSDDSARTNADKSTVGGDATTDNKDDKKQTEPIVITSTVSTKPNNAKADQKATSNPSLINEEKKNEADQAASETKNETPAIQSTTSVTKNEVQKTVGVETKNKKQEANFVEAKTNEHETISSGINPRSENNINNDLTFSLAKGDAYTSSNPIPMDPILPEGLIFKVQIGAFRKPMPDNTFKNLQPLSGETTRPGWIRYCLGLVRAFESANLLKKEVRIMGYPDAFVVAYFNGKRIPLYEAYTMISKANADEKKTYSSTSEKEFAHLAKFKIKPSNYDLTPDNDTKAFYGTVEKVPDGLVEYAVQVGVYKNSKTPSALNSLLPLNSEQTTTGLYRFTTGRFSNYSSADSMKRVAVTSGVKDAFIVIYRGGKKAGQSEAQQIFKERKSTSISSISPKTIVITATTTSTPSVTSENKKESGTIQSGDLVFKIQLGAFRENVPFSAVSSFLLIADKGITQETDARGLHIFYAGQYKTPQEAASAKSEIVSKGVKDAFVVAFAKGKRISAQEVKDILIHK